MLYNEEEKFIHINYGVIVFASGGFASIFEHNDNSNSATGECTYILQKITNKLKGMSTVMFHPFGIQNGKRILTGDIVSRIENIYYKKTDGELKVLDVKPEILKAIKSNNYHSNEMFENILRAFYNKEIYIKLEKDCNLKILKQYHLNENLIVNNMIKI